MKFNEFETCHDWNAEAFINNINQIAKLEKMAFRRVYELTEDLTTAQSHLTRGKLERIIAWDKAHGAGLKAYRERIEAEYKNRFATEEV